MTSEKSGSGSGDVLCPSCGAAIAGGSLTCASCGREARAPSVDGLTASAWPTTGQTGTSPLRDEATSPARLWPSTAEVPVRRPEPAAPAAPLVGMAALAATPVAARTARPGPRRGLLAGLAAVCLVALLAGGVYWAYAALLPTPSQTSLARFFPDSTVLYASVDLQAAQSGQGKRLQTMLAGPMGTGLLNSTGLNWAADVQPWAGPMVALGVYAAAPNGTSTTSSPVAALAGVGATLVVQVQSRNDGAAQTAVQKALAHEQANGATYTNTSYGGYTLYAPASGQSAAGGVLATGRGIVLMASSESAAHTAIDRAGGNGNSLYGDSSFQQAVGTLPGTRFGTLYYNVRSLTDPTGLGTNVIKLPFVDTYPQGAGALQWTSAGLRWQLTMGAAQSGTPAANLAGDTTSLAALVPADAASYVGVANLGGLSHELSALLASGQSAGKTPDFLQGVFGVPSSAAGTEVPAAAFVERSASGKGASSVASAALLREPSTQAASSLMASIAAQQHWSRKDMTVSGLPAASYFATASSSDVPGLAGSPPASAASDSPVVIEAYVNGVMVLASTSAELEQVVAVAQGHTASLSQAAEFRQLVAIAPARAAATVYGAANALASMLPRIPGAASGGSAPSSTSLGTLTWTSASLQVTYDVTMP